MTKENIGANLSDKVGLKSLSGITIAQNVERDLRRRDFDKVLEGIPEGSSLKEKINKQMSLSGDLDGLPPGHPLLVEIQRAKDDHDERVRLRAVELEKKKPSEFALKTRERQRNKSREISESRNKEEQREDERQQILKQINSGVDGILKEVRAVYGLMKINDEILNENSASRSSTSRLIRLLHVTDRGLSGFRVTQLRG